MKKALFILSIASLSLASCKKDYTCVCSTSVFGTTVSLNTKAKSTKKSATEWCKSIQNGTETVDGQPSTGITAGFSCSIK